MFVKAVRPGADFRINTQFHADAKRQLHIVAERFKVIPSNLFVAAVGLDVFFDVGDEGKAGQQKYVGAQIGNAICNVAVYAGN